MYLVFPMVPIGCIQVAPQVHRRRCSQMATVGDKGLAFYIIHLGDISITDSHLNNIKKVNITYQHYSSYFMSLVVLEKQISYYAERFFIAIDVKIEHLSSIFFPFVIISVQKPEFCDSCLGNGLSKWFHLSVLKQVA